MNIIKFKETVITNTSLQDYEWYNENLRGKYAYWIRCHYVVPLDSITPNMYVSFESTINNLLGFDYYRLVRTEVPGDPVTYTYEYVFTDLKEISPSMKEAAVLVESVPSNPDETSPVFIKIDHSRIKYVDLWWDDYYWMNRYIDLTETDKINSVDDLKLYNSYVPDVDIPTDELKRFRTWLATSLLDVNYTFYKLTSDESTEEPSYIYVEYSYPTLDERLNAVEEETLPALPTSTDPEVIKIKNMDVRDWSDTDTHVLQYYKNGMYDDTLRWTTTYGQTNVSIQTVGAVNSCGCGGSSNISSLYGDTLTVCDPVSLYKAGIKGGMVGIYTDLSMWMELPATYILYIKKFVDGIVQGNFGLSVSDTSNFYSCECLNKSGQENGITILKQLSTSLQYIADGQVDGHKNFILSSLSQWANELYELMEWN